LVIDPTTPSTIYASIINADIIKSADWIIDLGPEGGEGGGRIVAEGTPEEVAGNLHSHTGRWLARVL